MKMEFLKNATISVQLKYLSDFWRSYELSFINCKVELKRKWTKHCILSVAGDENRINNNNNSNSIIFTIKDIKLHVPVVTLSAKDNQKLSKRFSKRFERSVYWNKFKQKQE